MASAPVIDLHRRLREAGFSEPQVDALVGAFHALDRRRGDLATGLSSG